MLVAGSQSKMSQTLADNNANNCILTRYILQIRILALQVKALESLTLDQEVGGSSPPPPAGKMQVKV